MVTGMQRKSYLRGNIALSVWILMYFQILIDIELGIQFCVTRLELALCKRSAEYVCVLSYCGILKNQLPLSVTSRKCQPGRNTVTSGLIWGVPFYWPLVSFGQAFGRQSRLVHGLSVVGILEGVNQSQTELDSIPSSSYII